jgi:hypothetical protein
VTFDLLGLGKVKVDATWRNVEESWVKVSGTWKPVIGAWVKKSGVWKEIGGSSINSINHLNRNDLFGS